MRILAVTNDKYLYRRWELELISHTVSSNAAGDFDLILYDSDSAIPLPETGARVIRLSRRGDDGYGYRLPLPLGELERIISALSDGAERLCLCEDGASVLLDGERVKLTSHEYRLLALLISGGENYTSRDAIASTVWEGAADGLINIYIHYLRKKLERSGEKVIVSSRRFGYKINENFLRRTR